MGCKVLMSHLAGLPLRSSSFSLFLCQSTFWSIQSMSTVLIASKRTDVTTDHNFTDLRGWTGSHFPCFFVDEFLESKNIIGHITHSWGESCLDSWVHSLWDGRSLLTCNGLYCWLSGILCNCLVRVLRRGFFLTVCIHSIIIYYIFVKC